MTLFQRYDGEKFVTLAEVKPIPPKALTEFDPDDRFITHSGDYLVKPGDRLRVQDTEFIVKSIENVEPPYRVRVKVVK